MPRFLAYRDRDGHEEYVALDDISCFFAQEPRPGEFETEISLKSDPKYVITAQGTPHSVIQGRIVVIGE